MTPGPGWLAGLLPASTAATAAVAVVWATRAACCCGWRQRAHPAACVAQFCAPRSFGAAVRTRTQGTRRARPCHPCRQVLLCASLAGVLCSELLCVVCAVAVRVLWVCGGMTQRGSTRGAVVLLFLWVCGVSACAQPQFNYVSDKWHISETIHCV